jgi:hypothetical protein
MLRRFALRSLLVAVGASLLVSCSDHGVTAPSVSAETPTVAISGAAKPADGLRLDALWWNNEVTGPVSVSKVIGPAGGTLEIPQTGLTVSFPAGALTTSLNITITSDDRYVAYKMEPSGTRFLKDVTVTQLLNTTTVFGTPLRAPLFAAYIADDSVSLSGKVPVLEIEPSTTIFSTRLPLLPQAQVWIIRHFSRYMLASG